MRLSIRMFVCTLLALAFSNLGIQLTIIGVNQLNDCADNEEMCCMTTVDAFVGPDQNNTYFLYALANGCQWDSLVHLDIGQSLLACRYKTSCEAPPPGVKFCTSAFFTAGVVFDVVAAAPLGWMISEICLDNPVLRF